MNSTARPTVAEIVANANAARAKLDAQDESLENQIQAIDDLGPIPSLTEAQQRDRANLRALQQGVRDARQEISIEALETIDQSPDVARIRQGFLDINKRLSASVAGLQHMKEVADTTAKIVSAIAQIAAQLAKFAA